MADVIIKVLEPAEYFGFMTPEQVRLGLQLQPGEANSSDEYLNQLIEINSDVIRWLCRRVFAREKVRETWRCLGEPCDCADAASSRRLFLSHWPVKEEDIESVEIPRGSAVSRDCWELDEQAGRISVYCGTAEPIVVTYTGGYELPDDAPPALRYAAMLLVGNSRATAQQQTSAIASGIKSIGHKEARVTFQSPTEAAAAGGQGGLGPDGPVMQQVKNLLIHFQRLWA